MFNNFVIEYCDFMMMQNLDRAIDHKALYDTFSIFGNILSCKIAMDASGLSKGYGFVQFENEESAQSAIDKLNGMLLNDKPVYVGHFQRKQDRDNALSNAKFNNVYVKNLSESVTDDDLKNTFGEYGTITSAVVMRDVDGKSKCFGFVNFENADAAAKAVEALNGKKFDDKEWYVGKALKKYERELELKERHEQSMKETVDKFYGANLYLKNLDDSVTDEKLSELFSEFGTVTSCKVCEYGSLSVHICNCQIFIFMKHISFFLIHRFCEIHKELVGDLDLLPFQFPRKQLEL